MIKVLHISTECYPAAKAGGMGDVVGSLPYYSEKHDVQSSVIMPKYGLKWFENKSFRIISKGHFQLGDERINYTIEKESKSTLPYDLYFINIPGKFDRPSIYLDVDGKGFKDEVQRNLSFQIGVLHWLKGGKTSFDLLHCHDHMTGLIPFFMKYCKAFKALANTPSFYTIHNAAYKGMMDWDYKDLLPAYDESHGGLLDWDHHIHSMASAIRCCWKYSTVSPSYLKEMRQTKENLAWLFNHEKQKSVGIINGIDDSLWDPRTDAYLAHHFKKTWAEFKQKNKDHLCGIYGLNITDPLYCFIGRLAYQKGADILAGAIDILMKSRRSKANFIILGSGDKDIENQLLELEARFPKRIKTLIMYDEAVSHQLYAGCDYLIMPSRFEPCGLNQMFAMRYGTIPIVRSTGGLIDTVKDVSVGGTGFSFESENPEDLAKAVKKSISLFSDQKKFEAIRRKAGRQNFSWDKSMEAYAKEYYKLINLTT